MIRETLDILTNPFFAQRRAAEDAWDSRFQPVEVPCTCQRGWVEDEYGWYRCVTPNCDQGELIVELCQKCLQPESGCFCTVEDFR